ncbi:D-aminoacylase [Dehalobacterium formicoaceticum]|uniref:D-aminoacylase n=1 Tax=Dehalobacterium formicoaceticum TaxID=51515 RepID=A0ABT1Y354_9FIRM|nr:D-aminoacylase [Dehalobacterium formicoaceticum]MCR6545295.1 D-aminoacylase [Dehalobacterium formicoaceticum]
MKLLKRREFLLGLGSLGLLGFLNWDYVYGALSEVNFPGGEKKNEEVELISCDYVLENGLIVDGTGRTGYPGRVGIKEDRIVALGDFNYQEGAQVIPAQGLVITPGFIDLHTHTESYWLAGGTGEMVLKQGVTTQIGGNCGTSVPSIENYFQSLPPTPINLGLFVGYKNLRNQAGAVPEDLIDEAGLKIMEENLARGLMEGAFGLSVGLEYYPQAKGTKEEMIALCRVLREKGGFYSTHIRNENDSVIPALREAITIGLTAGVPVQYSHVKASRQENWGKMSQLLALMEDAASIGLDITGDVYPYTFSSLDVDNNNITESMNEEDMLQALQHPLIMVGSDSGLSKEGVAIHPRAYGNYPRVLSLYTGAGKSLSLEQAVHKMTGMPAKRLKLKDRGTIAVDMKADLAVFNLDGVQDLATRDNPNQLSMGMKYVFVNGRKVLEQGKLTGEKGGGPLRYQHS